MADFSFRALIPRKWQTWLNEQEQVQVETAWLQKEVDADKIITMPVLRKIKGWRNIEVFNYLQSCPDWTKDIL